MPRVVEIDNRSEKDNFITNQSRLPVTVACQEMFGSFVIHLAPGETRRVTWHVRATPYPYNRYSYDEMKYTLGEGEHWEVRDEAGALVMSISARRAGRARGRRLLRDAAVLVLFIACAAGFGVVGGLWVRAQGRRASDGSVAGSVSQDPGAWAGSWSGSTSQQLPVSFAVKGNAVTWLKIDWTLPLARTCRTAPGSRFELDAAGGSDEFILPPSSPGIEPARLTGNKITLVEENVGGEPARVTLTFAGEFSSPHEASGTLELISRGCDGSAKATWKATRLGDAAGRR